MSKTNPTIHVFRIKEYIEQPFVVELYLLPPYKKGCNYDDRLFGFKDLEAPELTEIFNFSYGDIEGVTEVYLLEKKFTKDHL